MTRPEMVSTDPPPPVTAAAPAGPAPGHPGWPSADPDPVAAIAAGRSEIDRIDARILALLEERRAVSQRVQQARRAAGGPRLEHSRETEVVRRYADRLGRPGPALALAVLEHCRGPVTALPRPEPSR